MLSPVQLFATPQNVTCQALCPWDYPIKNIGVVFHFLLQGSFPPRIQLNICIDRQMLYHRATWKSLKIQNKVVINKSLLIHRYNHYGDFPGGSEGKVSACNAGDLGSVPGLGRSREGNGYPLQYSCLKNPMDGGAWWASVHRVAKTQT